MLLNPKVLRLSKAASKEPQRETLACVHIRADGSAEATDGHMLVRWTPTEKLDPKEYPIIEGVNAGGVDEEGNPLEPELEPFMLPRESAEGILKALPKGRTTFPILRNVLLDTEKTNADGNAVMAVTNLETAQVFKPRKTEGQFPDLDKVIPTGKRPAIRMGFDLHYLGILLDTLKALNVRYIQVKSYDELEPIKIEAIDSDSEGEVLAVLMPCRCGPDDKEDYADTDSEEEEARDGADEEAEEEGVSFGGEENKEGEEDPEGDEEPEELAADEDGETKPEAQEEENEKPEVEEPKGPERDTGQAQDFAF
jgi:hypothetical protein